MTNAALRLILAFAFASSAYAADAISPTGHGPTGQNPAAAQSPAMTPAQIKAALADGERMTNELRQLAFAALDALAKPLPKQGINVTSAPRIEELRKKLVAECRKTVKVDSILDAKSFALQPAAFVAYRACRAASTASMAPCDALSSLAYAGKKSTEGPATPQGECRQSAGEQMLIAAIVSGAGASACSKANEFFSEIEASKRAPLCQALLSGAPDACAKAAAVAGEPAVKAECRAMTALRGASSAQACAAPGLPENLQTACRSHFASAGGCSVYADKIAEEHCGPIVRDRLVLMGPEIKAQEAAGGRENAHTAAMKAFTDKRAEVDALLFKISESLKNDPSRDPASVARLKKQVSTVSQILKDFKIASGK